MKLYGRDVTRAELAALSGGARALAGVRLVTCADGPERGVRIAQCRTGGGLEFDVLVDRCCDIGEAHLHGVPFSFSGATGIRHPHALSAEAESGLGFLRGFSGLVTTCGLDHVFGPLATDGSAFHYPRRTIIEQPLHGRVWREPARLIHCGEVWHGDEGTLVIEAEIMQAAVFGETLVLRRKITAPIGGTHLTIDDTVTNAGFAATSHMLLYHIDFGFPLLEEGARLLAPIIATEWASHEKTPGLEAQNVGWNEVSAPRWPFVEQVWQHRLSVDDAGQHGALLVNERNDRPVGVEVAARNASLPHFLEWQAYSSGLYALGLEFCTHAADGRTGAQARKERLMLEAGEKREYHVEINALSGNQLHQRIRTYDTEQMPRFPEITGIKPR